MIFVIATITVHPGKRDEFAEKAKARMIPPTREEPGCIFYDLALSATDPDRATFVERWETREALADHLSSEHMQAWRAVSGPLIAERSAEIVHPDKIEPIR